MALISLSARKGTKPPAKEPKPKALGTKVPKPKKVATPPPPKVNIQSSVNTRVLRALQPLFPHPLTMMTIRRYRMEVSGEAAKFIATDGFTITASAERIKQLGLSIALLRLWAPLSSTSAPLIPSWLNPKHTKTWMLYADKPDAELNAAYALAKAGAGSKYKKVYQDLFNTHLVSCLNTVASAMRSRRLDTMCKVYKHHVSTRTVSGELIVSLTMALSPIVDYEIVREKVCSLNVWQVVQGTPKNGLNGVLSSFTGNRLWVAVSKSDYLNTYATRCGDMMVMRYEFWIPASARPMGVGELNTLVTSCVRKWIRS